MDFSDCPEVGSPLPSLLVVDGDFVSFQVASTLEERTVSVKDSLGTDLGVYKNRTAFKNSPQYDEERKGEYIIVDNQVVPEEWSDKAAQMFRVILNSLLRKTNCESVLIAFGSEVNHRDSIPTPTKYKSSRSKTLRPLLLSDCKQLLCDLYTVERPVEGEADDVISYYQWLSYQDSSRAIVVCTPDKDARQTPCSCLYNPKTNEAIAIEGFGTIVLKTEPKYQVKATGRLSLYVQLLKGDSTDDYTPCDVYKQINNISKVSPMLTDYKVYHLLKDCQNDKEAWEVIVKQYKSWYPGAIEWTAWDNTKHTGTFIEPLQMCFDAAWMKRFESDRPKVRDILAKLEINY